MHENILWLCNNCVFLSQKLLNRVSMCVFFLLQGAGVGIVALKMGHSSWHSFHSSLCLGPHGVLRYFHLLLLFLLLLLLLREVQRCRRRGLCLYWPRGPRGRDQRIWRRWGLWGFFFGWRLLLQKFEGHLPTTHNSKFKWNQDLFSSWCSISKSWV